ncbi:MAG: hypothetical protein JSR20_12940 [Nitrospira sp.]|nr:hypothetical protein [Nitrospira sp.]
MEQGHYSLIESSNSVQIMEAKIATHAYGQAIIHNKNQQEVYAVLSVLGPIFILHGNLQKQVFDQFCEDLCAIRQIGKELHDSLKQLVFVHSKTRQHASRGWLQSNDTLSSVLKERDLMKLLRARKLLPWDMLDFQIAQMN